MNSSVKKLLWIDRVPLWILVLGAVFLGSAPAFQMVMMGKVDLLVPTSAHLIEKLGMLFDGTLARPIDIFDLGLHGLFPVLLTIRLVRMATGKSQPPQTGES